MHPNFDRQKYLEVDSIEELHNQQFDLWQYKYDGIWGRVEVNGRMYSVYSREGELKHSGFFQKPLLLSFTCTLLCEFMFGQQWANDPSRKGKLFCFDCVMSQTLDLTKKSYMNRYVEMRNILDLLQEENFVGVQCFHRDSLYEFWAANTVSEAYEGVVARKWTDDYSKPVIKLKHAIEDDFFVTGITEGQGKHASRMGALEIAKFDDQNYVIPMGTVGGGFTDEQRDVFFRDQSSVLGRVIQVQGKKRFESGRLRHPNFVCFRDDKQPKDCKV